MDRSAKMDTSLAISLKPRIGLQVKDVVIVDPEMRCRFIAPALRSVDRIDSQADHLISFARGNRFHHLVVHLLVRNVFGLEPCVEQENLEHKLALEPGRHATPLRQLITDAIATCTCPSIMESMVAILRFSCCLQNVRFSSATSARDLSLSSGLAIMSAGKKTALHLIPPTGTSGTAGSFALELVPCAHRFAVSHPLRNLLEGFWHTFGAPKGLAGSRQLDSVK